MSLEIMVRKRIKEGSFGNYQINYVPEFDPYINTEFSVQMIYAKNI